MKSADEIRILAIKTYPFYNEYGIEQVSCDGKQKAFINGYTQCQQDNAEKKYTEKQLRTFADALIQGIKEQNAQGYGDIKTDYESLIKSLNKQV